MQTKISFASCNLYNLNEPHKRMYKDPEGWSQEQYDRKVNWLATMVAKVEADVWGFQELWHYASLFELFERAGLNSEYTLLAPSDHTGGQIICAGAVRKTLLYGQQTWIESFPSALRLQSGGDDAQTKGISVALDKFSRPVLRFQVLPRQDSRPITVYVAHLKSKNPTKITDEPWFALDSEYYNKHREGIGAALATIRRTAEAAALRMLLTDSMKGNEEPVVVLGDLNDDQGSNTLNILTGQPKYLVGLSSGGGDTDLYSAGTLQLYRSRRDVYYTHIYQESVLESLDHVLVSQEFYDNSRKRVWAFEGMTVFNDHLNEDDHKQTGATDHGIIKASFSYDPA